MSGTEDQSDVPKRKRRWYQFSLRKLLLVVLVSSIGMTALAAYYRRARLDDAVLYEACVCGFKRAKVSNGQVILLEPNHGTPTGSVVATIEIKDGKCILRRIREGGTVGNAESYEIDHLGAKYYSEKCESFIYIVMADNWKLYPFAVYARVRNMFR